MKKTYQNMLTEEFLKQSKQIALNSNILLMCIESQILSLHHWQRMFADYSSQLESRDDEDIIEFIEDFVVRGYLDTEIIQESSIPELIS
jgi:hypothetical protein